MDELPKDVQELLKSKGFHVTRDVNPLDLRTTTEKDRARALNYYREHRDSINTAKRIAYKLRKKEEAEKMKE